MLWENMQTISHDLAWTLLHFLWQGALVGLLYVIGRRLTGTARQQHNLALAGLLVLLALPVATFWLLQQSAPAVTVASLSTSTSAATLAASQPAMAMEATTSAGDMTSWSYLLVLAWLLGTLVIAWRLVRDWRTLRTAIDTSIEPPADLLAMLERQIERLGVRGRVRLRLTARITSAGVYGWLRPVILLPTALALCMPRDQLETLLAHELAHIRRADFISNTLALVARTLLYFHPVVHRICHDLEHAREQLCDDLVVSIDINRLKYARALSSAESFRQRVQVPVPLLTATGGELSERVHRILDIQPSNTHQGKERAPLLLALVAIGVTLVGLRGVAPEQWLSVARPEFQAVYTALFATQTPTISAPDLSLRDARPRLPVLPALTVDAPDVVAPNSADERADVPVDALPSTVSPIDLLDSGMALEPLVMAPAAMTTVDTAPGMVEPVSTPAVMGVEARVTDTMANDLPAPRVLRQVQPEYPRSARWDGTEGSVTLAYRIDSEGLPADIRVVSAKPSGQFEQATIDALSRWRFTPGANGEYQQSFDFTLGSRGQRCEPRIGTRICR